jgi:hypothetical protein
LNPVDTDGPWFGLQPADYGSLLGKLQYSEALTPDAGAESSGCAFLLNGAE